MKPSLSSSLLTSFSLGLSNASIPGKKKKKKKKKSTNTTLTTRSVTHPPPLNLSYSLSAILDSLSYQPRPKPWAPPPFLLALLTGATTTTSIAVTLLFLSLPLVLLFIPLFLVVSGLLRWLGSIWNVKSLTIWLGFEIWAFGWFCRSEKNK